MILKLKNKNFTNRKDLFQYKTDINKIAVSNRASFGTKRFKYLVGYKDAKNLDLYIYFSKKWVHVEDFDENKISFLIKGYILLEKYNQILEKVKNSIKK